MSSVKDDFKNIADLQDAFMNRIEVDGLRFYNFILNNNLRGLVNYYMPDNYIQKNGQVANICPFNNYAVAFEQPQSLGHSQANVDDGILYYAEDDQDDDVYYFLIPHEYFDNAQRWEDGILALVEGVNRKAYAALYRVFPKLPNWKNTIVTASFATQSSLLPEDALNIVNFSFDFKTKDSSLFAYDGVIYCGRRGISYKVDSDEIYLWEYSNELKLVAAGQMPPLTHALTESEAKDHYNKCKDIAKNARNRP